MFESNGNSIDLNIKYIQIKFKEVIDESEEKMCRPIVILPTW
jgi:hypothetical protein